MSKIIKGVIAGFVATIVLGSVPINFFTRTAGCDSLC